MRLFLGKLLLLAFSCYAIYDLAQEFAFQRTATPREVYRADEARALKNNEYVQVHLPLDVEKAVAIGYISGREFLFVPFADTDCTLLYAIEGPLDMSSVAPLLPPFTGRLTGKDFADEWRVYGKSIELQKVFKRQQNMELPGTALVLYIADRTPLGAWQYFIASLAALYIFFFVRGVFRFFTRVADSASETDASQPDIHQTE